MVPLQPLQSVFFSLIFVTEDISHIYRLATFEAMPSSSDMFCTLDVSALVVAPFLHIKNYKQYSDFNIVGCL